jgi:hypothetical protein
MRLGLAQETITRELVSFASLSMMRVLVIFAFNLQYLKLDYILSIKVKEFYIITQGTNTLSLLACS